MTDMNNTNPKFLKTLLTADLIAQVVASGKLSAALSHPNGDLQIITLDPAAQMVTNLVMGDKGLGPVRPTLVEEAYTPQDDMFRTALINIAMGDAILAA
jgi:hypothetical protein